MAEELDIRSIWNKGKAKENPSALRIDILEKKGTKTTLYWVKTILWIEFWLTIVMAPFMVIYINSREVTAWPSSIYVFVSVVYLFYYQFLIRQINSFSYDGNVVESLRKVYKYLRFYVLHYKVVMWISMIIGFIYGFFAPENQEAYAKITTTKEWLIVVAVSLLLLAIIGGIMHLLLHLIYGKKIRRLKGMIKDLQQEA